MTGTETAPAPQPPRTWRPIILWSAGILLVVGLAWFVGAVGLLFAAGGAGRLPDPVGHDVDVHARPWSTELAPEVKLVPLELPPGAERKAVAVSPDGRLRAFIMETPRDPDRQIELVCIERVKSGQTLAVRGVPMPWRPYSGLAWASNSHLVFDRWSQPHYGVHYVVDAREMKLVHAAPFPDRFYLEQQGSQK